MTSNIIGTEQIEALRLKLLRWSMIAPNELNKALKQAGELVRREAQQFHLSGPKMPRGVGDPTNATLAVQTGTLRRSVAIRTSVQPGVVTAEVGTPVGYGRIHELGLTNERGIKMPERPFLRPSLEKKHSEIFRLIDDAYFKAFGKAG